MTRLLFGVSVFAVLCWIPTGANAQRGWSSQSRALVTGQIVAEGEIAFDALQIELAPVAGFGMPVTGYPSYDGSFRIEGAHPGDNWLRVVNPYGTVLYKDVVHVGQQGGDVRVPLPAAAGDKPATEVVSVEQLRHKVPGKARKAYRRAVAEFHQGRTAPAIEQLTKALSVDPNYYEAHMSLGVILLKAGESKTALEHFQQAVRLVPHSAEANANAAVALSTSGYHTEAEMAARMAIRYDSGNAVAHHTLGLSLLNQGRSSEEGIRSLRQAAGHIPKARLAGAQMLVNLDRIDEALKELQAYLGAGESDYDGYVSAWIDDLAGTEPCAPVSASNSE